MAKKAKTKTIGEIVRAAREKADLGQIAAAKKAGIAQSYWCEIETGAKRPGLGALQKIAAALGVSVRDLLPE